MTAVTVRNISPETHQALRERARRHGRSAQPSTPSLAELLLGIGILPDGQRKTALSTKLTQFVDRRLMSRVLDFNRPAARSYAEIVARARRRGKAIMPVDGQIAAIAAVHGLTVATRGTQPFIAGDVPVINPWEPGIALP